MLGKDKRLVCHVFPDALGLTCWHEGFAQRQQQIAPFLLVMRIQHFLYRQCPLKMPDRFATRVYGAGALGGELPVGHCLGEIHRVRGV